MTNSLIVQRWGDTVQAWHIAQIVHFDGWFVIEHNWRPLQTSVIRDGDIVTLRSGTEMTIHIDDQTQAQLIWPAQFILTSKEDKKDAYTMELIQWDFVSIQSLQEYTTQDIVLVSKDITVYQEKADTASHFQLLRKSEGHRIENKGANIRVIGQQFTDGIAIESSQTLSLAVNDITLIDEETQIARVLVQRDLSQTVAFVDVQEESKEERSISIDTLSSAFNADSAWVDEDIVSSVISTMTQEDKQVITQEQNSQLRGTLDSAFLIRDMQAIYIAYIQGDEQLLDRSVKSLQTKIANIYKAFDIDYNVKSESSLQSFEETTKTIWYLIDSLATWYYLPPRYSENLKTIIQWLQYISDQWFGLKDDATDNRDQLEKNIPNNLRFQ